jgi:cytochrome c556
MRQPLPTLAIAVFVAFGASSAADAQSKADNAIRYRQGLMHVMGWNFDLLGGVVHHTGALDTKEFALRATRLAELGPQIAEGFPPGSGSADKVAVNDAAAEIWTDAPGFQAKIDDYLAASKKLVETAKSGDEAQMKTQFREVTGSCKGCHDKYKAD